jgi:hypothetical protein
MLGTGLTISPNKFVSSSKPISCRESSPSIHMPRSYVYLSGDRYKDHPHRSLHDPTCMPLTRNSVRHKDFARTPTSFVPIRRSDLPNAFKHDAQLTGRRVMPILECVHWSFKDPNVGRSKCFTKLELVRPSIGSTYHHRNIQLIKSRTTVFGCKKSCHLHL